MLGRSIAIRTDAVTPQEFMQSPQWGAPRGGKGWTQRAKNWYNSKEVLQYQGNFAVPFTGMDVHEVLPIFPVYAYRALLKAVERLNGFPTDGLTNNNLTNSTQEKTMKNTLNKVIDKNKQAVQIAAKLSAGKTANSFFLNKLVSKFPWYAKVFSKKNKVAENPVAKVVAAQTAMTLVTHFAPTNDKLNYIAEGMVEEALVDVTVNSQTLENMIGELESLVTLPDFGE